MIKGLRLKFILIVTVIVIGMLAAIFGLLYQSTAQTLKNESLRMLQTIAADPLGEVNARGENGVYLPYFCVVQEPYPLNPAYSWKEIRGSDVYVNDDAFISRMMNQVLKRTENEGILEDGNMRYLRRGSLTTRLTVVFVGMAAEKATLENQLRNFTFIGVGAVPVVLLLAFALSLWMTSPVEKAWAQQRQFVSDASHELKTPLTVILANAEMLQEPDGSEETRQRLSANILTMSTQMRSLVERMLDLARADNGAARMVFQPLDMAVLTSDVLLPFEPVYYEKGLQLHCHLQESLWVKGSAAHLTQVADILLDNAGKYAYPNSWVQVVLRKQGGHCLLSVATPGEVISKADLKNIFKRFYRADKARTEGGSYGLGLSIAESVVKEHRGRIWAESAKNINTFYVLLPLTSARPAPAIPAAPEMPEPREDFAPAPEVPQPE